MAALENIIVEQGTTIRINYSVNELTNPNIPFHATTNPYIPINISNTLIRMQVRTTVDSSTVLLNLTLANGKFVITSAANGLFNLKLSPIDTSVITIKGDSLDCVYDLELEDSTGNVTRAFEGIFTINKEVTR